jgi:hypothetical protein
MTGADGVQVPLPLEKIKSEFKKSDIVIFPKVTPGCVLEVRIKFLFHGYFYAFEQWMSQNIPVLNSLVTFVYLDDLYDFAFKEYGDIQKPQIYYPRGARHPYRTWEKHSILPRQIVTNRNFIDAREPVISIALQRVRGRDFLGDWESLSKKYSERLMKASFFGTTVSLRRLTDTLLRASMTRRECADTILQWVQENISLRNTSFEEINPDITMKARKGNKWEIATVLKEMFDHAGFEPDIIVSRSKNILGFDETFPCFNSLDCPIVTVPIDGRVYPAYPYSRAYPIGQVPAGFLESKGLSLSDQTVRPLHADKSAGNSITIKTAFSVSDDPAVIRMATVYSGHSAFELKENLYDTKKEKWMEYFQAEAGEIDPENRIADFKTGRIDDRTGPLRVSYSLTNATFAIQRNNTAQYRFSLVFPRLFDGYDTSRVSDFQTRYPLTITHTLRIENPHKAQVEVKLYGENIDNALFSATTVMSAGISETTIIRTITINNATLTPQQMRALVPDIRRLNAIRDSYATRSVY